MNVNEQILKALGVSYKTYDDYRYSCFLDWCAQYGLKLNLSIRQLSQNKNLFNWYQTQWIYQVDNPFFRQVGEHIESGVQDLQYYWEVYETFPGTLLKVYPGVLLQMIKKTTSKTSL